MSVGGNRCSRVTFITERHVWQTPKTRRKSQAWSSSVPTGILLELTAHARHFDRTTWVQARMCENKVYSIREGVRVSGPSGGGIKNAARVSFLQNVEDTDVRKQNDIRRLFRQVRGFLMQSWFYFNRFK